MLYSATDEMIECNDTTFNSQEDFTTNQSIWITQKLVLKAVTGKYQEEELVKVIARFEITVLTFSQSLGNTPKRQVDKLILVITVPLLFFLSRSRLDLPASNRILPWAGALRRKGGQLHKKIQLPLQFSIGLSTWAELKIKIRVSAGYISEPGLHLK